MKAVCGGELDGFCKGLGIRPCPDHERAIMATEPAMRLGKEPRDAAEEEE